MLRVEVVVDREARNFEPLGDVFDRLAKRERSELVQTMNCTLLARSIQPGDWLTELSLYLVDEPIERIVNAVESKTADERSLELQRDVAWFGFVRPNDATAKGSRNRLDSDEERVHGGTLSTGVGHGEWAWAIVCSGIPLTRGFGVVWVTVCGRVEVSQA